MIAPQQNKYLETSIQTATPTQLLIMLYDGAIRFCKLAINALNDKNNQEANNYLIRVQDIISEFTITLDRNMPIADELLHLYDYFIRRLTEANVQKQIEPIEEVMGYLQEMKETWVQAALLIKNLSHAANSGEPAIAGVKHG